ncbi:MAG: hypothetical protein Kow0069_25590 [Promethearchaeota archaeon]
MRKATLIHALYVLDLGGAPLYARTFTHALEDVDSSLVCGFFKAILDFSRAVVKKSLSVIEVGDLRCFFKQLDKDRVVVLVTDPTASHLLVNDRLKKVAPLLLQVESPVLRGPDGRVRPPPPGFNEELDSIARMTDDEWDEVAGPLKEVIEREVLAGEVAAGAVLGLDGRVLYNSMAVDDLAFVLREVEIRQQAQVREVESTPRMIWATKEKVIFSQAVRAPSFGGHVHVVLAFDGNTSLGMADYALEDVVKKLTPHL